MSASRPRRSLAWRDGLLLLPLVGAGLALARGHRTVGLVLIALAIVAVVARLVVGDAVHRPIVAVARVCEQVLTTAAVVVLWLVLVLPGWMLRTVGRTDRRQARQAAGEATAWAPSPPAAATSRSFGAPAPIARSRGSLALQAVGLVMVLLAIDVGVGVAWQRFTRSDAAGSVGLDRDGTVSSDRADRPALAGYPWADRHLRDMQLLPQAYWPFVVNRPLPFESPTVHVLGWERRSYQAGGSDDDVPVVAFFGGSTTFGEGQRDEHTIPSEVARIAEAAGTPIRVINYGQRSWTAWQEMVLFDQLTADPDAPDAPDLVVFYDGGNEVLQQQQDSTAGWPTTFGVDRLAEALTGRPAGAAGEGAGDSLLADVTDWYEERSMALRGLRAVRSKVVGPEAPTARYDSDDPPAVVGRRAAEVYLRAQAIARATAERRGIVPVFFWQPVPSWRDDVAFATATREVAASTTVIADALDDHQEVYFDQIHTNEVGARIVAERMWETLGPEVARAS